MVAAFSKGVSDDLLVQFAFLKGSKSLLDDFLPMLFFAHSLPGQESPFPGKLNHDYWRTTEGIIAIPG